MSKACSLTLTLSYINKDLKRRTTQDHKPEGYCEALIELLRSPLASGSAPAQYVTGTLLYIYDCDSGARDDYLVTAR